jgi:hypothetical protein
MEENKFEKQVQQKMEELKIHPSDSVWEKIAARIGKKKRSNRGLILFLLLFCFCLTGGYLLWNIKQHSIIEFNTPGKNDKNKNNFEKTTNEISTKENKTVQPETNFVAGSINQKNDVAGKASERKNINRRSSSQHYKNPTAKRIRINSGERATIAYTKNQEVKQEEKDKDSENMEAERRTVQQQEIPPANEKINDEKDSGYDKKDSAHNKLNKDSLSKLPSSQNEMAKAKDTLQQTASSPAIVKHVKKNRWKPGLFFSGGISSVSNSFLSEDKSLNLTDPNSSGSLPPGITPQPSATKSGFGFIIGAFAEKNISPKTKLEFGISFKSFSTSNKVGRRNDTTGFYDYRTQYSSNTYNVYNTYSNHYNFIELPVTLKVQIGRGKKMPFSWEGGLIISELISSNALQFNQGSGYYYKDNSLFNKTQIGLNTAISVTLFSKQKNSVLIGPYFYYSASGLANKGLYNNKHFVFTGLRTEIIFGK